MTLTTQNDVNILTYDVGIEFNRVREREFEWRFSPFLGAGVGGRSYLYDATGLRDRTSPSVYGALGSEFQVENVAIRLEARDNVFRYRSPIPGVRSRTRNDIDLMVGLAYHFR
jgi:hypothetical protein